MKVRRLQAEGTACAEASKESLVGLKISRSPRIEWQNGERNWRGCEPRCGVSSSQWGKWEPLKIPSSKADKFNLKYRKIVYRDFPGCPVVKTALPPQAAQVQALVGELRFYRPCGMAKV